MVEPTTLLDRWKFVHYLCICSTKRGEAKCNVLIPTVKGTVNGKIFGCGIASVDPTNRTCTASGGTLIHLGDPERKYRHGHRVDVLKALQRVSDGLSAVKLHRAEIKLLLEN